MYFLATIVALSLALALLNVVLVHHLRSRFSNRYKLDRGGYERRYLVVSTLLIATILIEAEAWIFTSNFPSIPTYSWLFVSIMIVLSIANLLVGALATAWIYVQVKNLYDPAQ